MPTSSHRTKRAAIAKGKTLLGKGNRVEVERFVSQDFVNGKPSGKTTSYVVTYSKIKKRKKRKK